MTTGGGGGEDLVNKHVRTTESNSLTIYTQEQQMKLKIIKIKCKP